MSGENENVRKGFAGLSELVSEIGDIEDLSTAEAEAETPSPTAVSVATTDEERPARAATQKRATTPQKVEVLGGGKSGGRSGDKWVLGVISIAFMLWILSLGDDSNKNHQSGSPSGSRNPAPSPAKDLRTKMPPVGTSNTLAIPEIRWCVREGIRIDTMKPLVNTDGGIDEFNRIVAAYNGRCGNFRYYESDLQRAEREVEANRRIIVEAAIDEAMRLDRKYQAAKASIAEPSSSYQILEFEFKKDPTQEWQSLHDRAESLVKQGKLQEAATVGEQALHVWDGEPDNAHVASSLDFMAVLYSRLGRNADAGPMLERSLQLYRRLYGPNDARVIRTMKNKARLYRILGRESEAVLLEKQVRELEGR